MELTTELQLGLLQSDVKRIVNSLPVEDALAALDYMLRNMWEGEEYAGR